MRRRREIEIDGNGERQTGGKEERDGIRDREERREMEEERYAAVMKVINSMSRNSTPLPISNIELSHENKVQSVTLTFEWKK